MVLIVSEKLVYCGIDFEFKYQQRFVARMLEWIIYVCGRDILKLSTSFGKKQTMMRVF